MSEKTKKCKFCGEEILSVAIKCRHCSSNLVENNMPIVKGNNGETLGIYMLAVPFASILLMWFWIGEMNLLQSPGSKLNFISLITVIITAIIAAVESNQLGFGQQTKQGEKPSRSPVTWFFLIVLLWIAFYPSYLYERSKKGKINLLIGGIIIEIIFLITYFALFGAIDEKVSEIQNMFN